MTSPYGTVAESYARLVEAQAAEALKPHTPDCLWRPDGYVCAEDCPVPYRPRHARDE